MNFLRLFLLPFSLIYGLVTSIRNRLYDWSFLKSIRFSIPVISVGNLRVGGTGKTPHIEYLIRLLMNQYPLATLGRGYRRKTKGFQTGSLFSSASELGDEPMQIAHKFKDIVVAVDEKRAHGISELTHRYPKLEVILLDDAFQHRAVKPGISILLTDFYHLYTDDYLLPAGRLRESISGAIRANIIIVTKTPKVLSPITKQRLFETLKPFPNQKLYFSYIQYGEITPVFDKTCHAKKGRKYNTILLFAGIANTYPLEDYLKQHCTELSTLTFPDHHQYSSKDLQKIIHTWDNIFTRNKLLVTTEKDVMRLKSHDIQELVVNLPLHYIPIEVAFHGEDKDSFDKQILEYVAAYQRDIRLSEHKSNL